jgi:ribosome-associated heat shock protein Hsp15
MARDHRSHEDEEDGHGERMRLDKWLWAARFFKTRQFAIDAINGGKVHLNGQRVKPGKEIGIGAKLLISKDQYLWDITVSGLNSQRRPAPEAARLYREEEASITRRQEEITRRREEKVPTWEPGHKPDKKDRRLIHRFKRQDE